MTATETAPRELAERPSTVDDAQRYDLYHLYELDDAPELWLG